MYVPTDVDNVTIAASKLVDCISRYGVEEDLFSVTVFSDQVPVPETVLLVAWSNVMLTRSSLS